MATPRVDDSLPPEENLGRSFGARSSAPARLGEVDRPTVRLGGNPGSSRGGHPARPARPQFRDEGPAIGPAVTRHLGHRPGHGRPLLRWEHAEVGWYIHVTVHELDGSADERPSP